LRVWPVSGQLKEVYQKREGSMTNYEAIKTDDKQAALDFLAKHLESKEPVNAGIQNLDGVYTVEVSKPIKASVDSLA
jgi:hypothetical protein